MRVKNSSLNSEQNFSLIVEAVYNMPLTEKEDLQNLLQHNISELKREEIKNNFKKAKQEEKSGKLTFSSSIKQLKKML